MARGGSLKLDYGSYREPLHEKPFFHIVMFFLLSATLIISIFALNNTKELKKALITETLDINDFLQKLTSHQEMRAYVGVSPLNIIQVNNNNLPNLQSQIAGLDNSYINSFIVQYTDKIIVYDYKNDQIKGNLNLQQPQQGQLPADFFNKLYAHQEAQNLQDEQPIGGQLDSSSLATLKQQFPDVYENAKVGDFLLRYTSKLIIYDYNNDVIINSVNLE